MYQRRLILQKATRGGRGHFPAKGSGRLTEIKSLVADRVERLWTWIECIISSSNSISYGPHSIGWQREKRLGLVPSDLLRHNHTAISVSFSSSFSSSPLLHLLISSSPSPFVFVILVPFLPLLWSFSDDVVVNPLSRTRSSPVPEPTGVPCPLRSFPKVHCQYPEGLAGQEGKNRRILECRVQCTGEREPHSPCLPQPPPPPLRFPTLLVQGVFAVSASYEPTLKISPPLPAGNGRAP